MQEDREYIRHTMNLIFDVPEDMLRGNKRQVAEILNGIFGRMAELVEADERTQRLMRRYGIMFGWEEGTWEKDL